jgi:hypothetical protein
MSGGNMIFHRMIVAACFISMLALMMGCKKSPIDSHDPIPATATGSYVGYGNLGQGDLNIWLSVITDEGASDTTVIPSLIGYIKFSGVQDRLISITTNEAQDTLAIQFARNSIVYRATSPISTIGLEFTFSMPTSLSVLRLNREIGGANMSGWWQGTMYSIGYSILSDATMRMDQPGVDFFGDLDVEFVSNLHGDIDNGAVSAPDFEFEGTGRYGTYTSDIYFSGSYVHQDTIAGNWQVGSDNLIYDSGSFQFYRNF